jgi:hypothetical protein
MIQPVGFEGLSLSRVPGSPFHSCFISATGYVPGPFRPADNCHKNPLMRHWFDERLARAREQLCDAIKTVGSAQRRKILLGEVFDPY